MRISSGVSSTLVLSRFWLPFGRPGLLFGAAFLSLFVFIFFVRALAAAFSASVRTTCSTIVGYERRSWTLIKDSAKIAMLFTGLPSVPEKKRSSP